MSKVKILVDDTVFELVKNGRVNMLFTSDGSENHKEVEKLKSDDDVTIVNRDTNATCTRRFVRTDSVGRLYRGKGYPEAYRTRTPQVRIHIDKKIKSDEQTAKAEAKAG